MLPIGHSPEAFQAYAAIDYCHYVIKSIYDDMAREDTPINKMIDFVTGRGEDEFSKQRDTIIYMFEKIIENKKIIQADYSDDEKTLNDLIEIKQKHAQQ